MNNKLYNYLVKLRRNYYKNRIISYYQNTDDEEIREIITNIKKNNELKIFNYSFCDKYENMDLKVEYDNAVDMYYIVDNNKSMYFKRGMDVEEVRRYYRGICLEQDEESPHKYTCGDVTVKRGDVILDLGAAEGNFVFKHIDEIEKVIIVECDKGWVEALQETFKNYSNVIIINKLVGNLTSENSICIDDIYREYGKIDFIKMDIEGAERKALEGAKMVLDNPIKLAICTYHKKEDYDEISNILKNRDFIFSHSKGYMTLHWQWNFGKPYIRRGVIRARK